MTSSKIFSGVLLAASVLVLQACNTNTASNKTQDTEVQDAQAQDTEIKATATLSADQETAEVTSDASGSLEGTYNKTTGELAFKLKWSGLTGPPTMMHFHGPAGRGADAGVKIGITGFPAEATGSVSQTVTVEEADRADLLAGKWYVNIHTEKYGPGEIRGQVEFENGGE